MLLLPLATTTVCAVSLIVCCHDCRLSTSTHQRTGAGQGRSKMVVECFAQPEDVFSRHLSRVHAKYTAVVFEFLTRVHVSVFQSIQKSQTLLEPTASKTIKTATKQFRNNNAKLTTAVTEMMQTIATEQCLMLIVIDCKC